MFQLYSLLTSQSFQPCICYANGTGSDFGFQCATAHDVFGCLFRAAGLLTRCIFGWDLPQRWSPYRNATSISERLSLRTKCIQFRSGPVISDSGFCASIRALVVYVTWTHGDSPESPIRLSLLRRVKESTEHEPDFCPIRMGLQTCLHMRLGRTKYNRKHNNPRSKEGICRKEQEREKEKSPENNLIRIRTIELGHWQGGALGSTIANQANLPDKVGPLIASEQCRRHRTFQRVRRELGIS